MPQREEEEGKQPHSTASAFTDETVRKVFMRKVYSILLAQLLVTALIVAPFVVVDAVRDYFRSNRVWFFVALGILLVVYMMVSCFKEARRVSPMNYILLCIVTLAVSFLLGTICSTYEVNEVLLALGICIFLSFALTVFAFQTKINYSVVGAILFVALGVFIVFFLMILFFPSSNIWRVLWACVGALIASIYLIIDTQAMIGGNHVYEISPDEYVFAALCLYTDIVTLFFYLLTMIGGSSRGSRNQ